MPENVGFDSLAYAAAIREFERVEGLYAQLRVEWVRICTRPIRLDYSSGRFPLLIAVDETTEQSVDVDWAALAASGEYRATAVNIAQASAVAER